MSSLWNAYYQHFLIVDAENIQNILKLLKSNNNEKKTLRLGAPNE